MNWIVINVQKMNSNAVQENVYCKNGDAMVRKTVKMALMRKIAAITLCNTIKIITIIRAVLITNSNVKTPNVSIGIEYAMAKRTVARMDQMKVVFV